MPHFLDYDEYYRFYNLDYEFIIKKREFHGASFYFKCSKIKTNYKLFTLTINFLRVFM